MKIATTRSTAPAPISAQPQPGMPLDLLPLVVVGSLTVVVLL
jgi:hypothetical protein